MIFSISRKQVQPVWSLVAPYLKSLSKSDDKTLKVTEVIKLMVSEDNEGYTLEIVVSGWNS